MNSLVIATLPPEKRSLIERELQINETIHWIGQPVPRLFSGPTIATFVFAIPWTAFALFGMAETGGFKMLNFREIAPGQLIFTLFLLPFLLIGFGMLLSPWWSQRNKTQTYYVLTDRRALTFVKAWSMTIQSFDLQGLTNTARTERSDGSGDLVFFTQSRRDSEGTTTQIPIGFLGIPEVKNVQDLIFRLQK